MLGISKIPEILQIHTEISNVLEIHMEILRICTGIPNILEISDILDLHMETVRATLRPTVF